MQISNGFQGYFLNTVIKGGLTVLGSPVHSPIEMICFSYIKVVLNKNLSYMKRIITLSRTNCNHVVLTWFTILLKQNFYVVKSVWCVYTIENREGYREIELKPGIQLPEANKDTNPTIQFDSTLARGKESICTMQLSWSFKFSHA